MDSTTEILQAEAAIQKLVEEISRYSSHSREAEVAVNSIQGATKELITSREVLDIFSQKINDTLQKNTEKFASEAKIAATHLIQCAEQENKENNRLSQTNNQLDLLKGYFDDIVKSFNIAQKTQENLQGNITTLASELKSILENLVRCVEQGNKENNRLNQTNNQLDLLKGYFDDIVKSFNFSQKTQENLQVNMTTLASESKSVLEKLMGCVEQGNKENNRLDQTNNQLLELTERLEGITQVIKYAIEENRLSLAEKLQSLEEVLIPFKDTIVKQETTLSEFTNDFIQLKENLNNIQKNLSSTIEKFEQLPVEIKADFYELSKHLNENEDALKTFKKETDHLFQETFLLINQLNKTLIERFENTDLIVLKLANKITENAQHSQSFQQEVFEKFSRFQEDQNITVETIKEAQIKVMKVSKWNLVLTIFNFLLVGGGLIFILSNSNFLSFFN